MIPLLTGRRAAPVPARRQQCPAGPRRQTDGQYLPSGTRVACIDAAGTAQRLYPPGSSRPYLPDSREGEETANYIGNEETPHGHRCLLGAFSHRPTKASMFIYRNGRRY